MRVAVATISAVTERQLNCMMLNTVGSNTLPTGVKSESGSLEIPSAFACFFGGRQRAIRWDRFVNGTDIQITNTNFPAY